jgi:hypothetical protein
MCETLLSFTTSGSAAKSFFKQIRPNAGGGGRGAAWGLFNCQISSHVRKGSCKNFKIVLSDAVLLRLYMYIIHTLKEHFHHKVSEKVKLSIAYG